MTFKTNMMIATLAAVTVSAPALAQNAGEGMAVTTKRVTVTQVAVTTAAPQQVDADMQMLLNAYSSLEPKPLEGLKPSQARKQPTMADAVKKLAKERDIKLPGNEGLEMDKAAYLNHHHDQLDMNITYVPKKGEDAKNRPVIVYFHGGGWVIANPKVYQSSINALARKTGAIVMAPQYRQAPEDKFPAAHEDAFAGYQWALANAKAYGGDPTKVAVVGESAGGNLAANVGMMAVSANTIRPIALGLIYPVAGVDMTTPSYQQNADAKPLNMAGMQWFFSQIATPEYRAEVMSDPRLNILGADVKGLPPTTVITAGIDPLRTDGELLALKLRDAGVDTTYKNYEGVTHEFFGADAVLGDAKDAQDLLAAQLQKAFAKK